LLEGAADPAASGPDPVPVTGEGHDGADGLDATRRPWHGPARTTMAEGGPTERARRRGGFSDEGGGGGSDGGADVQCACDHGGEG
jgi:hypothetical protein